MSKGRQIALDMLKSPLALPIEASCKDIKKSVVRGENRRSLWLGQVIRFVLLNFFRFACSESDDKRLVAVHHDVPCNVWSFHSYLVHVVLVLAPCIFCFIKV
jgi:hypothetical protein